MGDFDGVGGTAARGQELEDFLDLVLGLDEVSNLGVVRELLLHESHYVGDHDVVLVEAGHHVGHGATCGYAGDAEPSERTESGVPLDDEVEAKRCREASSGEPCKPGAVGMNVLEARVIHEIHRDFPVFAPAVVVEGEVVAFSLAGVCVAYTLSELGEGDG